MDDCIFCKIVKGEIPAHKVYEDDEFLAFLDIHPFTEGHVLIIPKDHYRWVYDVPEFCKYWDIARSISRAQINGLDADYVSFLTLGLQVPHAHIHSIPRYDNDNQGEGINVQNRLSPSPEDLSKIANIIKSEFIL